MMDFPSFAAAYDHFSRDNAYNELYERPAMRALLPADLRGLTILDAGCAGGLQAEWMAQRGARVVAVDCDADMTAIAERRLAGRARVVRADLVEPLAFIDDRSIDYVFCSLTLHYLRDWGPTLSEFRRVLADGGRLLVSTHHPCADCTWGGTDYFEIEQLTQVWTEFGDTHYEVTFYRRPLSETVAALQRAGFLLERVVEPKPQPAMMQSEPRTFDKLSRQPWFIIFDALAR
ncbi:MULTISPECIES: class I SAM-dependent methyltransferase [Burkholderia]|uniref:class I SAM-dependent methyltransferase n=1 Tax=Burkholderia TaxID=32008 RepID=UPI00157A50CF|nr:MULTISPECIES: class I SAM-dependent methyltransferase [Burkholderia]MCU9952100.1 methyltransferase domain-containing protein [Burkholderia sp. BKH01]